MHNLGSRAWVRGVYEGQPTSDATTSDGAFGTPVDVTAQNPRVLFLIHGVKLGYDSVVGDTSDATMHWYIMKQTTFAAGSDADFTDYANIIGATHGVIAVSSSTATSGPYMLDVNAIKATGGSGSLLFHAWSSDATKLWVTAVAIGYGGESRGNDADNFVSV